MADAPPVSSAEYNATPGAVDDLADQLATDAAAPQDDVDESADVTGLREQDTDVVIDKTDKADPLYARTCSSFEDERLELPAPLLKGLNEMRFVRPSKIQAASLPKIWAGRNLLAQSHNGTGKTACFVLGMLKVVSGEKCPQALCICPTRELAQQIGMEVLKMGKYMVQEAGVRVKVILREERYERGATMEEQVIIGTPGKVWTLINMRVMGTAKMRIFVLDEADEMLALGGLGDQSKRIRQKLPKNTQTLFFSATWTDPVIKFAKQLSAVSQLL
jgi:ATP-dependent RNA helicase DDX19/DBP5